MSDWTSPKAPFPGVIDYEREYIAGNVIRSACEHDSDKMRFYLTCSVGELAQRVVVALAKAEGASIPTSRETPA